MALSNYVKGTASNFASASTVTPAIPTASSGDLMLLFVGGDGNGASWNTFSSTQSWTKLHEATQNGTTVVGAVFAKIHTGSESNPQISWTTGGNKTGRAIIIVIPGADSSITDTGLYKVGSNSGSSTTVTTPAIGSNARTGSSLWHFAFHATAAANKYTPDFRMAEVDDNTTGGTTAAHASMGIFEERWMGSGADPQLSRTQTVATGAWISIALWVPPASADSIGKLQSCRGSITAGGANNVTATFPANLTSGTTLIAGCASVIGTVNAPITDVDYVTSSDLNFTKDKERVTASETTVAIWRYSNNTNTTAAVVTGRSSGGSAKSMVVTELSGVDTTTPIVSGEDNSASGTGTDPSLSVTIGSGERHIVGACQMFNGQTNFIADLDYGMIGAYNNFSGAGDASLVESRVKNSSGSETVDFNGDTSTTWVAVVVAYQPTAASGGSGVPNSFMLMGVGL